MLIQLFNCYMAGLAAYKKSNPRSSDGRNISLLQSPCPLLHSPVFVTMHSKSVFALAVFVVCCYAKAAVKEEIAKIDSFTKDTTALAAVVDGFSKDTVSDDTELVNRRDRITKAFRSSPSFS
jgi:hypothetical protein